MFKMHWLTFITNLSLWELYLTANRTAVILPGVVLKEIDPLTELRTFVGLYRFQKEAAAVLGISETYLSALLGGRATFSDYILEKLGLRETVVRKAAS